MPASMMNPFLDVSCSFFPPYVLSLYYHFSCQYYYFNYIIIRTSWCFKYSLGIHVLDRYLPSLTLHINANVNNEWYQNIEEQYLKRTLT